MSNSTFKFKQFEVSQDRCGMKISTDAVVLGALVVNDQQKSILDIGSGTGVISLMLAQRFPNAHINAVELDRDAFVQSSENIKNATFGDRIKLYHQTFQDYARLIPEKFDLVISNPPYFPDHIKTKDLQRNLALHNDSLPFQDLVDGVVKVLKKEGEFWVILPPRQMKDLVEYCQASGLYPNRKFFLKDKEASKVIREIYSFVATNSSIEESVLFIKNADGTFSNAYRALLRDFLIIF